MRDQSWLGLALCIIINIPATCRWLSRGTWGISGSTWVTALFHLHGWGVKQGRGRGRERERPPPSSSSSPLLPLQPVPRHRTTAGTELWFLVEQPTGHEQWWMHLTDLLNLFLKRTPEKHTRSKWEKNKNQQNDGMHSAKISVVIKVNKPKGLGGLLVKSSVNCNTWSLRIFFPLSQRPHSDMIRLHCENQRTRITPSCLTDFKGISATHTHKINRLLSQLIVSAVLNALPVLQHQHCHSVALTNL